MIKKLIVIVAAFVLLGISPAQRAAKQAAEWEGEASCDRFIRSLPGLTMWLRADSGVTSSNNAVSAWASKVGTISFAQATGANQPIISNGSNRENRLLNSATLSSLTATASSIASNVLIEDNADTEHCASTEAFPIVTGASYRVRARVKSATRHFSIRFVSGFDNGYAHFDLGTCAVNSTTGAVTNALATADGDYCIVSASDVATGTTNVADHIRFYLANPVTDISYDGDATSGVEISWVQAQSTLADPVYLATTAAPEYRSPFSGGKKAVWFDGSNDTLTSTAQVGDLFAAGAKSLVMVFQPSLINAAGAQNLWSTETGDRFILQIVAGAATIEGFNYDGSSDFTNTHTIAANKPYVASYRHGGGNIYLDVNGATTDAVASGNTSNMTYTTRIASQLTPASWYAGALAEVITSNQMLSSSDRARLNRCLARRYQADLQ